jgi:protocatechuate 3,4-dioxygenase beta subunit
MNKDACDQAHDGGLLNDLDALAHQAEDSAQRERRRALRWMGLAGTAATVPLMIASTPASAATSWFATYLARVKAKTTTTTTTGTTTGTSTGTTTGACSVAPEETAGPYPGDGSNSASGSVANALMLSGIVRSDIRSSIAGATGVAAGVPLKLILTLKNTSCTALSGYAIYLWHCDAVGRYSMYSSGVTNQNYLRGVQSTDANGAVTFQTIFPGCYSGRMPHMHFEVYRDANTATSFSNKLKTSQLAFPVATCQEVYANNSAYSASVGNLAKMSFASDNVFSDGVTLEMTSVTGNATDGYVATIAVSISA